jgi:hypothetical protein
MNLMNMRTRKAIGSFVVVMGLFTYVLFAGALGAMATHESAIAKIIYYPIAGIIWIFPVRYLMIWMNKPDPE